MFGRDLPDGIWQIVPPAKPDPRYRLVAGYDDSAAADAAAGISSRLAEVIHFFMENDGPATHRVFAIRQGDIMEGRFKSRFPIGAGDDIAHVAYVSHVIPIFEDVAMRHMHRVVVAARRFTHFRTVPKFMDVKRVGSRGNANELNRQFQTIRRVFHMDSPFDGGRIRCPLNFRKALRRPGSSGYSRYEQEGEQECAFRFCIHGFSFCLSFFKEEVASR